MTTLGIIGSGQLGRMLALAALPLGVHCRFLALGDDAAIREFAHGFAPIGDAAIEHGFATGCTAITTEIENIDAALLARVTAHAPVWPPQQAIAHKRDRRAERALLDRLGLPQPRWAETTDSAQDSAAVAAQLAAAWQHLGGAVRAKAAVGGYDGRGQWRLSDAASVTHVDLAAAPFVLEAEVAFDEEFSVIAAFPGDGAAPRFWTPSVNQHVRGILSRCEVAAGRIAVDVEARAQEIVGRLGQALNYRGVLAVEMYRVGEQVLVNEFAPRVHNSGHWTIEGAAVSQFENHVRAALGMPLGSTALRAPCISWNVIGAWPDRHALLDIADLHLHDYGKAPRAGRKLGHLTLVGATASDARVQRIDALIEASRVLAP